MAYPKSQLNMRSKILGDMQRKRAKRRQSTSQAEFEKITHWIKIASASNAMRVYLINPPLEETKNRLIAEGFTVTTDYVSWE